MQEKASLSYDQTNNSSEIHDLGLEPNLPSFKIEITLQQTSSNLVDDTQASLHSSLFFIQMPRAAVADFVDSFFTRTLFQADDGLAASVLATELASDAIIHVRLLLSQAHSSGHAQIIWQSRSTAIF